MTQMVRHSFTLNLPTSTPWAEVENIAYNQIVIPHMLQAGKNSFADLGLLSRHATDTAGVSTFVGEYLL
ncbi:hypothetical protein [Nocardia tengchongensis]|uniref:hypothetical protein n=1 Tax=Nocardia tengchongensis TaxID=2055889 RepID=UPI0036A49D7D